MTISGQTRQEREEGEELEEVEGGEGGRPGDRGQGLDTGPRQGDVEGRGSA